MLVFGEGDLGQSDIGQIGKTEAMSRIIHVVFEEGIQKELTIIVRVFHQEVSIVPTRQDHMSSFIMQI